MSRGPLTQIPALMLDSYLSRHDFEGIRKAVQYGERYRPNQAVFLAGQKEAMKVHTALLLK